MLFNKTLLNTVLLRTPDGVCLTHGCSVLTEVEFRPQPNTNRLLEYNIKVDFANTPSSKAITDVEAVISEQFSLLFSEFCCYLTPSYSVRFVSSKRNLAQSVIVQYSDVIDLNQNSGQVPSSSESPSSANINSYSLFGVFVSLTCALFAYLF